MIAESSIGKSKSPIMNPWNWIYWTPDIFQMLAQIAEASKYVESCSNGVKTLAQNYKQWTSLKSINIAKLF